MEKRNVIFDNYDVNVWYDYAVENIIENERYSEKEEIPETEIWDEVAFLQQLNFDDEMEMMKSFFEGKTLLVCGNVGRWNGSFPAGKVIEFDELCNCWNDCDYIKIYDENGHFFIQASHHDGTNVFEVKILTEKGADIWDRWNYYESNWENLNEREVHEKLWKNAKYTHIPHYAREVFGCKTR